jgi:large conductance mechanosensitive channel
MLQEFKKFAMRGNVIDLAVGIIIGGAFGKIVSSLVNDIIMPVIGIILGGINFSSLKLVIPAVGISTAPALTIMYGQFIQSVVDFLIVAVSVFLMVKAISRFQKKEEVKPAAPPAPSKEETLLTEIRDALRSRPV